MIGRIEPLRGMNTLQYPSLQLTLRPGSPDFQDLPWQLTLDDWKDQCFRLGEAPRGLSRHPCVFVMYGNTLYALKEMAPNIAQHEFELLCRMEEMHLPIITPVGYTDIHSREQERSVLITHFLDCSLPYRTIFMTNSLTRYLDHLLDAMAELLVQLHLAGVFWGDCSLSNTLFRRDAGTLQAYLVDAETVEIHSPHLEPALRLQELQIMEENVDLDLASLSLAGALPINFPVQETGKAIRQIYRTLWEEITHDEVINPGEYYRVHERIRRLNAMGFSVKEVELPGMSEGGKLRLRIFVTDRYFHREQLLELTGLEAEEMQARTIVNEIQEIKATLSRDRNQNIPLNVAAFYWYEHIYQPVMEQLKGLIESRRLTNGGEPELPSDPIELYCQVLEHKWYLSERAQCDVGHHAAVADYLKNIAKDLHNPAP